MERLHLVTPDGAVEGRLTLTISGLRPLDLLNPRRWLEGLDGSGELSMPEALLHRLVAAQVRQQLARDPAFEPPATQEQEQWIGDEAQRRIDRLVRQEFALRQGGQLHTRMRIGAGLLTINGKSIPLPLLAQLSN